MSDKTPTSPVEGAADRPQAKRWPRVLLVLSLTLNLLILGVIAGAQVRDVRDLRRAPPPTRETLRDTGMAPFFDAMPRDMRGRMGAQMRSRMGAHGPDRDMLAQEMRDMIAVLKTEPYDAAALTALLNAQQARAEARAAAGRKLLLNQIAGMSAAERERFADELSKLFSQSLAQHPPAPPPTPRGN